MSRCHIPLTGLLYLKAIAHLAAPLEDVLDHVLAFPPHAVALLHEKLVEAHLVPHVCVEGGSLKNHPYYS